MSNKQTRKFGLFTTIAMITGVVMGSGIFFKADDILKAVDGNVFVGCLCFLIGAIGIVFGGLTIREYASDDAYGIGGIITYCESAFGKTWGYLTGWFQVIFYLPCIAAIVAWVGGAYTCVLFNLPGPFSSGEFSTISWVITLIYITFFYALNVLKTKYAGRFQNISMVMKIVALLLVSICGLLMGNPSEIIEHATLGGGLSSGFFTAIVAVAYAYDGWLIAPSIAHEIKNPQRNLPLALLISPLIIMCIYVLYFVGLNSLIGSNNVLILGDGAVGQAGLILFGSIGAKLLYVFIIISVLGTLNGIILGYIRLPYALAIRKEIPFYTKLSVVDKKLDIPLYATFFAFALTSFWLFMHFLSTNGVEHGLTIFAGLAIDNLPIVMAYIFYCSLFIGVIIKFIKKEIKSIWRGIVFPTLALLGGVFVLYGGINTPGFNIYMLISLIGIGLGLVIRPNNYDKE